jgi:Protein of unknown function (DUF1214)
LQTFFATPDKYPVDSRGVAYTIGWFRVKHLGAGQFYVMTFTDKDGHHLDGGSTYRLNVPANAPVTQYWHRFYVRELPCTPGGLKDQRLRCGLDVVVHRKKFDGSYLHRKTLSDWPVATIRLLRGYEKMTTV